MTQTPDSRIYRLLQCITPKITPSSRQDWNREAHTGVGAVATGGPPFGFSRIMNGVAFSASVGEMVIVKDGAAFVGARRDGPTIDASVRWPMALMPATARDLSERLASGD